LLLIVGFSIQKNSRSLSMGVLGRFDMQPAMQCAGDQGHYDPGQERHNKGIEHGIVKDEIP
jgi:hypothetical protein